MKSREELISSQETSSRKIDEASIAALDCSLSSVQSRCHGARGDDRRHATTVDARCLLGSTVLFALENRSTRAAGVSAP
jgi:hypothetical protein